MSSLDIALLGCRFVFDGAALFLWGASAFLCLLVPHELRALIWGQLRGLRRAALFCIGASVVVFLPLQAANLGDGWQNAFDLHMLYSVASATSMGQAWCWQALASLLLLISRFINVKWSRLAYALLSAALLVSLTFTGHAVMDDGKLHVLHQLNDALHLLSAGAWAGALVVVLALLPQLESKTLSTAAKQALMRFSTAGHVVVLLVLLSGAISTFLVVGGWPLNWSYLYQRLLALKIALVLLMGVAALANRYILVPRMRDSIAASRLFRWSTLGEIAAAGVAILLVAWFGMLEPN